MNLHLISYITILILDETSSVFHLTTLSGNNSALQMYFSGHQLPLQSQDRIQGSCTGLHTAKLDSSYLGNSWQESKLEKMYS